MKLGTRRLQKFKNFVQSKPPPPIKYRVAHPLLPVRRARTLAPMRQKVTPGKYRLPCPKRQRVHKPFADDKQKLYRTRLLLKPLHPRRPVKKQPPVTVTRKYARTLRKKKVKPALPKVSKVCRKRLKPFVQNVPKQHKQFQVRLLHLPRRRGSLPIKMRQLLPLRLP